MSDQQASRSEAVQVGEFYELDVGSDVSNSKPLQC